MLSTLSCFDNCRHFFDDEAEASDYEDADDDDLDDAGRDLSGFIDDGKSEVLTGSTIR